MTLLRAKKNRRRVDPAKRTAEVKAVVARRAPVVARVVLGLALALGLGAGARKAWSWAQRAPQFALTKIDWAGAQHTAPVELARAAGLVEGSNLLALDLPAVEKAIATNPWVKSVRLTRRLPSRLSVLVEEHQPAAIAAIGDLYLIDGEGHPFKKLAAVDALDLPLITGLDRDAWTKDPLDGAAQLRLGLAALAAWERRKESARPSEARLDDTGVTLVLADGVELRLGEGDLDAKLDRFSRIRSELGRQKLTAQVIRLDHRTRPGWVAVQLSSAVPEKGSRSKGQ
ncbi:MAG: FtsQ-type POTRA domain-containing protein [Myxococcaceae bacterium]|nr:FtsQ-type POTRA domain-containing protein [Myxococcaceae bacterium]